MIMVTLKGIKIVRPHESTGTTATLKEVACHSVEMQYCLPHLTLHLLCLLALFCAISKTKHITRIIIIWQDTQTISTASSQCGVAVILQGFPPRWSSASPNDPTNPAKETSLGCLYRLRPCQRFFFFFFYYLSNFGPNDWHVYIPVLRLCFLLERCVGWIERWTRAPLYDFRQPTPAPVQASKLLPALQRVRTGYWVVLQNPIDWKLCSMPSPISHTANCAMGNTIVWCHLN